MKSMKSWQCVIWVSGLWLLFALSGAAQTVTAPQTFERVKVLMLQNGKSREVAARLRFTGTEVVIEDISGKVLLQTANDEVKAAGYYYSKHRRWQPLLVSGIAFATFVPLYVAVESGASLGLLEWIPVAGFFSFPFTGVLALTHSKRHWLTLRTRREVVTLRLDKRHYRSVITTLENQTNLTVAWQGER